jgi:menaquinone-dependent protoporphyrinogen IX oxidase
MRYVVLYKSFSGFTRKYAEWIAADLDADIFPVHKFSPPKFKNYDAIIFGGSLHAVGINGISIIKKNFEILKDKPLFIFATGASPDGDHLPIEIIESNFSETERAHIKFFYMRGGFNYRKLNLANKILMRLLWLKLIMKKEKERNSDERGMLAAFKNPIDCTRKENIRQLVSEVKGTSINWDIGRSEIISA